MLPKKWATLGGTTRMDLCQMPSPASLSKYGLRGSKMKNTMISEYRA